MLLKVIFEPSEDGGYTVFVPALPGCVSEGETLDEAKRNILETIHLYLEPDEEEPLPQGAVIEEISI